MCCPAKLERDGPRRGTASSSSLDFAEVPHESQASRVLVFLGQKENKVRKVHPAAYRGSGAQREVGPALMPLNQPGPRVGVPEAASSGA